MRSRHFFVFALVAATASLTACGGDDGGGGGGTPDAKVFNDAPVPMDAPAALTGLGQKCGQGMPACPTSAPQCLTVGGGAVGFCSLLCHANAQIMTGANGQVTSETDLTPDNPKCAAIYTGTPGTAACEVPVNVMPTPMNPLQSNTTFTYQAHCAIQCGAGNTCPSGLTCNTQVMWCVPS